MAENQQSRVDWPGNSGQLLCRALAPPPPPPHTHTPKNETVFRAFSGLKASIFMNWMEAGAQKNQQRWRRTEKLLGIVTTACRQSLKTYTLVGIPDCRPGLVPAKA